MVLIRRKSDADKPFPQACRYHRAFLHEANNQYRHVGRGQQDPEGHLSPCWCCCPYCYDLSWYHEEPPSFVTPDGALRPRWTPDVSAGRD